MIDKIRDLIGDFCYKEGCEYSKQSEVYNECKNMKNCQVWQLLKYLYEKEVK